MEFDGPTVNIWAFWNIIAIPLQYKECLYFASIRTLSLLNNFLENNAYTCLHYCSQPLSRKDFPLAQMEGSAFAHWWLKLLVLLPHTNSIHILLLRLVWPWSVGALQYIGAQVFVRLFIVIKKALLRQKYIDKPLSCLEEQMWFIASANLWKPLLHPLNHNSVFPFL